MIISLNHFQQKCQNHQKRTIFKLNKTRLYIFVAWVTLTFAFISYGFWLAEALQQQAKFAVGGCPAHSTWYRIHFGHTCPWAPPRSAWPARCWRRPGGSRAGGSRRWSSAPGACPQETPLLPRDPAPTAGPSRARHPEPRRSQPLPGWCWTPHCRATGSPANKESGGSTAWWLLKGGLFMLILHTTLSNSQWLQLTKGCTKCIALKAVWPNSVFRWRFAAQLSGSPEQLRLVEDISAQAKGFGSRWSLRSLSIQPLLWFCNSVIYSHLSVPQISTKIKLHSCNTTVWTKSI